MSASFLSRLQICDPKALSAQHHELTDILSHKKLTDFKKNSVRFQDDLTVRFRLALNFTWSYLFWYIPFAQIYVHILKVCSSEWNIPSRSWRCLLWVFVEDKDFYAFSVPLLAICISKTKLEFFEGDCLIFSLHMLILPRKLNPCRRGLNIVQQMMLVSNWSGQQKFDLEHESIKYWREFLL